MKEFGVVIRYNGFYGIIETTNKDKYILLKKEIKNSKVSVEDKVEFEPDILPSEVGQVKIARFVKVLTK